MDTSAIGNQPASGNESAGQQAASYRQQQGTDAFDAAFQRRRNIQVGTVVLASVLFFLIGYVVGRREEARSRQSLADQLLRQLQDWFGQSGRALSDLREPLEHGIRTSGEALTDIWSKAAASKAATATSKAAAEASKAAGKWLKAASPKKPKFLGVF
jgi:hypothetical protein